MKFGTQVVSLGVIIAILINYYRSRKMPLISTRVFTAFLWMSFFNIVLEFFTLYTITHLDAIPAQNRFAHQLFIGSMDALVFLMFLYVDLKSRIQKRYSLCGLLLRILPLTVSLVFVAFGELYYVVNENGVFYSYGSMATTVYYTIALYAAAVLYLLAKGTNGFTKSSKTTIFLGIIFWACLALYQGLYPSVLLSSMGISLMTLFLYISFEHPTEYADPELKRRLNRFAFELILDECFSKKKPFYVVSIHLLNESLLISSIGSSRLLQLLSRMAEQLLCHTTCYRSKSNVLSMVFTPKQYNAFFKNPELLLDYRDGEINIEAGRFISVISCPEFASSADEVLGIISFMSDKGEREEYSGIKYANEDAIKDMQYIAGIEKLLQAALADNGFDVFYQPIYDTRKKSFSSSEALIRLKDSETMGFISPEIFIPLAEKQGMIKDIGNIVFEKVCSFAAENKLSEAGVEYIEVNLSGVQSVDSSLVNSLNSIMKKHGISPSFINLEITETAAIENGKLLLDNMRRLKELGCQFSMDDFGTGYSNLAQMAETEFDLIKLDKSLLWSCYEENSKKALCILNGCIDLIQSLDMHIVQEGVETEQQANFLIGKGVSYLQGYYYSRPLAGGAYLEFLKEHN